MDYAVIPSWGGFFRFRFPDGRIGCLTKLYRDGEGCIEEIIGSIDYRTR